MTTQLEVTRFWNEGVIKCDQKDYAGALDVLKKISEPTSKVTFDIGCIGLFTGDLVTALKVRRYKEQSGCGLKAAPYQLTSGSVLDFAVFRCLSQERRTHGCGFLPEGYSEVQASQVGTK
jgi:hypothetical protein